MSGKYERKAQSQRKHGPLSISGAAKAPAPPPIQRPDWRGPGYVKKRPSRPTPPSAQPTPQEQPLSTDLQQLILNITRDSFPASTDFEALKPTLQEINEALSRRDIQTAFESQEKREAYALRWSPSRGLAYANVLAWICERRREDGWVERFHAPQSIAKVVCFGGSAAEVTAFAGLLRQLRADAAGKPQLSGDTAFEEAYSPVLDLQLVDTADWSSVVSKLHTGVETPPVLSKYASATARASNASLIAPGAMSVTFRQADILDLKAEELYDLAGVNPTLITLFLTLNDLYTTSVSRTTAFLRKLEAVMAEESLLLVIDGIGAAAETGPTEAGGKSYPMNWLLDRLLLGKLQKDDDDEELKPPAKWEKVMDEEMMQHKLDEKVKYPGSLENLKFQMHVFKRL